MTRGALLTRESFQLRLMVITKRLVVAELVRGLVNKDKLVRVYNVS